MKQVLAILALITFTASSGCADTSNTTYSEGMTVTNISQEFNRRAAEIDPKLKDGPRQRLDLVEQLLEKSDETFRGRELSRLGSQPSHTQFDDLLVQAFVERLLISGDIKSLESLLKVNCPEYIAAIPLEFVLARSKQSDAILLLPHAYSIDATNVASQAILRCLTRAFPTLKKTEHSDASFVAACEIWWIANHSVYSINSRYPHLPSSLRQDHEREQLGLFVLKGN